MPHKFQFVIISLFGSLLLNRSFERIAILGGGPAGLTAALCLKNYMPNNWRGEVHIYESRSDISHTALGGGVQISGASVVLKKLGLMPRFKQFAIPFQRLLSRDSNLKNIIALNVADSTLRSGDASLIDTEGDRVPHLYSVMRDALIYILIEALTATIGSSNNGCHVYIHPNSTCTGLRDVAGRSKMRAQLRTTAGNHPTSGNSLVEFEEEFDLVLCADGINSVGARYIRDQWDQWMRAGNSGSGLWDMLAPLQQFTNSYSGVRITYGVTGVDDEFILRPESGSKGAFHQFFGNGLYTLSASYGGLNGIQHMLAVVYKDTSRGANSIQSSRGENSEWHCRDLRNEVKGRLERAGLGSSQVPALSVLLEGCDKDRFIDLGVKDRLLPEAHWASPSGRVILLGDAAHSMPPFLGQGANQALQDADMVVSGLASLPSLTTGDMSSLRTELVDLTRKYEDRRKLFTTLLGAKSTILGRIETFGGFGAVGRDSFLRVMGAVGVAEQSFLDAAQPRL